eukprot:13937172-Ditylum_brightwellii.AAC.2
MPKLVKHGANCMFVEYALNNIDGVYRMWSPDTGRSHISCDVVWLKQMCYVKRSMPDITVGLGSEVRESIEMDSNNE